MKVKNLILIALVLSSAFYAISCKKTEKEEQIKLSVAPIEINAPGTSRETYLVNISTTGPWTAKTNKEFVTMNPSWGTGTAEMSVTVDKNRTDEIRDAIITISVQGLEPVNISIYQEAGIIEEVGKRNFFVKVDGSADADGLTWANSTTFEKAYEEAVPGETINFAAGTYIPTLTLDGTDAAEKRNRTFYIGKNITLIGGYPSNPKPGDISSPNTNKTILCGDLGDASNIFHVLVFGAPVAEGEKTTLKGFTIKDGNANGSPSPSVNGVNLEGSRAGGFIISGNCNVEIESCEFINNKGKECGAGHINKNKTGSVTLKYCTFKSNEATGTHSGAIGITKSVVYIYDSYFDSNKCVKNGGAIMIDGHWSQTTGDQAYAYIYNTTFSNNMCNGAGSAFYGIWGDHAAIVNCTIANNNNSGEWGSVAVHLGEVNIINTTIANNTGVKCGGIVSKTENADIKVINSIISGNTSKTEGLEDTALEKSTAKAIFLTSCIVGSTLFNASSTTSDCGFSASEMLGKLSNNGGYTLTMPLIGSSNPAITNGLTSEQLNAAVKESIVPAKDADIVSKDQRGEKRTGKHMGACSK